METSPAAACQPTAEFTQFMLDPLHRTRLTPALLNRDQPLLSEHVVKEQESIRIVAEELIEAGERVGADPQGPGNVRMPKRK